MKNFRLFLSVCAFAAAMLAIGCEKDTPVEPSDDQTTAIKLAQSALEVDAEGGEFTLGYTVDNPISGAKALLISDVAWIVAGESDAEKLYLTVERNISTDSRTATLVVRYPSAEEVSFELTQLGVDGPQFSIASQSATYNGFTTDVKAADKDMYYVLYLSEVDYFLTQEIDTDDELFLDDKLFFEEYANYFGMNLGAFMDEYGFVYQGDRVTDWTGLVPMKQYAAYVYGIEFNADRSDYTRATPVYYVTVETLINEIGEHNFGLNVSANGPDVSFEITTNGYDGNYACYVFSDIEPLYLPEGSAVNDAYTLAMAQQWMSDYNSYSGYYEKSNAEILAEFTYSGDRVLGQTFSANSNYSVALFAVEEVEGLLMLTTEPIVKSFATTGVEQSDMTFEIELNSCYSRVADLTITPSNDEESYTILLVSASQLGDMTDGDEIVEWATTTYWLTEYYGVQEYYVNYLQPDTDYSVLVFGLYADAATTGLTRLDFRTESAAPAETSVERIDFNGPYDPMAIYALDQSDPTLPYYEGFFVMWMETIPSNDKAIDVYHYIYDTATIDAWGDDAIFEDLVAYYYEPIGTGPGEYGVEYRLAAAVQDARGNISDMVYTEPFIYNESDLRDPQEFIDKVYGGTRSRGQMVVVGRNGVKLLPEMRPSFELEPSVVVPAAPSITATKYDKLAK